MANEQDKNKKVELHDLEASANEAKVKGGKGFSKALGALGLKNLSINPSQNVLINQQQLTQGG